MIENGKVAAMVSGVTASGKALICYSQHTNIVTLINHSRDFEYYA